jgi:hypothetical protein
VTHDSTPTSLEPCAPYPPSSSKYNGLILVHVSPRLSENDTRSLDDHISCRFLHLLSLVHPQSPFPTTPPSSLRHQHSTPPMPRADPCACAGHGADARLDRELPQKKNREGGTRDRRCPGGCGLGDRVCSNGSLGARGSGVMRTCIRDVGSSAARQSRLHGSVLMHMLGLIHLHLRR